MMEVEQAVPQAHPPSFDKLSPISKKQNMGSPFLFAAKKLSISILIISLPLLYLSVLRIPPSTIFKDNVFWFLMSNSIIILVAADSGIFSSSNCKAADHYDLYDEFVKHSRAARAGSTLENFAANGNESTEAVDKRLIVQQMAVDSPIVLTLEKPMMKISAVDEPAVAADHHEISETNASSDQKQISTKPPLEMVDEMMPAEEEKAIITIEKTSLAVLKSSLKKKKSSFRHQKSLGDASTSAREDPKKLRRSATEKTDQHYTDQKEEEYSEYAKLTDEELNRRVEEFIRRVNRQIRLQPKD